MKILSYVLLTTLFVIIITSLHAGSVIKANNTTQQQLFNITTTTFSQNTSLFSTKNISINDDYNTVLITTLTNIIYKTINTMTYITLEVSKLFVITGYNNEETFDSLGLINIMILIGIIMIMPSLFFTIMLIIYLIYFLIKCVRVNIKKWKLKKKKK